MVLNINTKQFIKRRFYYGREHYESHCQRKAKEKVHSEKEN